MLVITALFRYRNMFCNQTIWQFYICYIFIIKKSELIKNIEKLTFWAGDNEKLHLAKHELLSQINNLDLSISGKGFFTIDRQFLAGVSSFELINITLIYNSFSNVFIFSRLLLPVAHT